MSKRRQISENGVPVETAAAAANRFFRAYYRHSTVPDEDTLFDLLNALHSLNDKLGKFAGIDLRGSAFFTVLRKLRNLFHHEAELLHEVGDPIGRQHNLVPPSAVDPGRGQLGLGKESRGFRLASIARDGFAGLTAVGITTALFFHIMVNMLMTIGWAPVTGVPLPFLSYGGTALIVNCIQIGLLQNVAVRRREY